MLKAFSIIRSLFLCLFILAGSGCLYNVHELMDHSICERSKDVIDLEPLTHFEKKSELPKANSEIKSNKSFDVANNSFKYSKSDFVSAGVSFLGPS